MGKLEGQVALITGAGTGLGRAAAVALAEEGAVVALAGRTASTLGETAAAAREVPGISAEAVLVYQIDVADLGAVQAMVNDLHARYGHIDILVNNAGLNVPHRALSEIDPQEWLKIIDVNLNGAYWCVHAVLPIMRAQGRGTLIHIGSNASRRPSSIPGAAYTASKAGLWGLNSVINAEERQHGIRSCVIMPGDTNTPILDRRPHPPSEAHRIAVIQPEDVAECIALVATLPDRATIEEIAIMPTNQR
jgi:NADP-dependent 3-hydroxy acid dehydrogenase YdfG